MQRSEQSALYHRTPRDPDSDAQIERIREQVRAESVSYGEIAALQSDLVAHIHPDDVEMLEWAGVSEH